MTQREKAIVRLASVVVLACASTGVIAQQAAPKPVSTVAWAPKPLKTPGYSGIQKPWIKLADLKAKHKNDATWRELLVDDGRLTAEYFGAAPGTRVAPRFHPDTREWFAIVEGQVRVEIEGHAARKSETRPSRSLVVSR